MALQSHFSHKRLLLQLLPQELAKAINQNLVDGDKDRWVDVAKMIQASPH